MGEVGKNSERKSVVMTLKARSEAQKLQSMQSEFAGKVLRLYLEGKGCDGFYYGVTFDAVSTEDIQFDQGVDEGGEAFVPVIVDPETMQFVEGAEIDWVDDERGRGFLVNNPEQKAYRGKFFKRDAWREKLKAPPSASPENQ